MPTRSLIISTFAIIIFLVLFILKNETTTGADTSFSVQPALSHVSNNYQANEWYAKVVDEIGQPIEGALVYYDGQLVTTDGSTPALTDANGVLELDNPTPGKPLVGLVQVYQQSTNRAGHSAWAYRTYLTSLNLDDEGNPHPDTIGQPGQQLVTIRKNNPLILFNIVVSVEWNADEAYLATIENAFRQASDFLYDVTDGQMAFGQVTIYDNTGYWADADFQISVKNTVRPYAFVGGITSGKNHAIRVGRFWDGSSSNHRDWDQPSGYRTLIHNFGHYALHLYDEYFKTIVDDNGNFVREVLAACTSISVMENPNNDAANASIMYYQYTTSELADSDRWNEDCQNTEQHRLNGESDWETILRYYKRPDWTLNTPTSRGSVMAGPAEFPSSLPFPKIVTLPMYPLYLPIILHNYDPLANGDFELGDLRGWDVGQGSFQGHGSGLSQSIAQFEGSHNALLGNPLQNNFIPIGFGAIFQTLSVQQPYLQLRYRVFTNDIVKGKLGYADTFEVSLNTPPAQINDNERDNKGCDNESAILNPTGVLTPTTGLAFCGGYAGTSQDVGTLRDLGWKTVTLDLQDFQGENVTLYLALWSREYEADFYNDKGFYNTWVYIDDVQLTDNP